MKKITLFIFLFSSISFSQKKNLKGQIEYQVYKNIKIDTDTIKDSNVKNTINKLIKNDGSFYTSTLNFDSNDSYFNYNFDLKQDDSKIDLLRISLKARGSVYQSASKKASYSISAKDNSILIKDDWVDFNWTLTKQTKTIAGFKCYFAKGIKKVYRRSSNINKIVNVYAWYTPEINVSFGPHNYGGLPGLILQLNENGLISYVANKVTLSSKTEVKNKPKKKILSRDSYNKIQRDYYLNN